MPEIRLETHINAQPERCFDLMRDMRIHTQTTLQTNEKAIDGVTDGMIWLGQTVTFEGTHFGIRQKLKVMVIEFDRPRRFVDAMVEGAFRSFVHVHEFESRGDCTMMSDILTWTSPMGMLGQLVDSLFIKRHLRGLVELRNRRLKQLAESMNSE